MTRSQPSRAARIRQDLHEQAHPATPEQSRRFFKTGPGEYSEADQFIGVRVPVIRQLAKQYKAADDEAILDLLQSPIHEERLLALLIWVQQYRRASQERKEAIYTRYLEHREHINNWDLIDVTTPHIVGAHLEHRARDILYELVSSDRLWDRRIAILATLHFIRAGDLEDTWALSERLLNDPEDLMHKATGWMLREAGKKDGEALRSFIRQHGPRMPRTMLRYAIEKFPEEERQAILKSTRR